MYIYIYKCIYKCIYRNMILMQSIHYNTRAYNNVRIVFTYNNGGIAYSRGNVH